MRLPLLDAPPPVRPAVAQPLHTATRPFHLMTKPIGPICNLDCTYCFYLEKENLYADERKWKMSDELLESYISQYIAAQPIDDVSFAWQGGEPTLLGVGFFRKVVELQRKYALGKRITNAFQTNGTLLNDEWGEFFAANEFLVGLSVDGPAELHDTYRVDKQQKSTFDGVMRGLGFLKKHGVNFNTLTVVNRANSRHPLKVYRFLRDIGSGFVQFIPLVERANPGVGEAAAFDLDHAAPPELGEDRLIRRASPVTDWSVRAADYGPFLTTIFDEWVRRDVGSVFVQQFDVALGHWMGLGSSLCVFGETCGSAMAVEHNGDVYSCDHYVYPKFKLGNLLETPLARLAESPFQIKFGTDKRDTLPRMCRECDVRFACNGECPKHRFVKTPEGDDGLNYLCPAYLTFFHHIDPYMKTMRDLLRTGRPAAAIMPMLQAADARRRAQTAHVPPDRNAPCPCGSGKKYKKCCAN